MHPFVLVLVAAALQAQSVDPIVSASWLAEHLNDPRVVVVQVEGRRDPYAQGHIPGARFVALGDFSTDGGPGRELPPVEDLERVLRGLAINDDSHVVIYGSTSPLSAARLWMTLDFLGHADHASLLNGGLTAWRAAGGAVTTEEPAPRAGTITRRARAPFLVAADWIHPRLDDPNVLLIDARPDDEYTGADNGMGGMVHPGHIPGAYQMYWEKLVQPDNRMQLLPIESLRREFEAAGAAPDKAVVAYCMVGLRASLTYLVGRMLGYDMKFYDGSWHDWGSRDLPYVTGTARR
jgi:thiosulfate/3-mercaptopyruvate sulfurtransferase